MAVEMNYVALLVFKKENLTEAVARDIERMIIEIDNNQDKPTSALNGRLTPLFICPENCGPGDGQPIVANLPYEPAVVGTILIQQLLSSPPAGQVRPQVQRNLDNASFAVRSMRFSMDHNRLLCFGVHSIDRALLRCAMVALLPGLDKMEGYLGDFLIQAEVDWEKGVNPAAE